MTLELVYSRPESQPEPTTQPTMSDEELKKYWQDVESCGILGCSIARSGYEHIHPLHKSVYPLHFRKVEEDFIYWLSARLQTIKVPDWQIESAGCEIGFTLENVKPMLFIVMDEERYLGIFRSKDLHLVLKLIERFPLEEMVQIWLGNF